MKKIILIVIALAIVAGIVYYTKKDSAPTGEDAMTHEEMSTSTPESTMDNGALVGEASTTPASEVKEFAMDSFMKMEGTKRIAGFSVKEITVKKGDKVKITVTNTAGTHDFNIDEYGVDVETPEGQKTVIEFTADKVGDFKYYCAKYNHRQLGQEGTIHVTE
jgi:heme/copper-type cytochrome/quinol oxidase subunit 2